MCGAATVQLLLVYFLQQHWVFKFLAVTPSKALFPLLLQNNSFQFPDFDTYSFPYLTLGNHVDGGHCCGLMKAFCNLSISCSAWNIFKLLVIKGRQVRVKSQFVSVHLIFYHTAAVSGPFFTTGSNGGFHLLSICCSCWIVLFWCQNYIVRKHNSFCQNS